MHAHCTSLSIIMEHGKTREKILKIFYVGCQLSCIFFEHLFTGIYFILFWLPHDINILKEPIDLMNIKKGKINSF